MFQHGSLRGLQLGFTFDFQPESFLIQHDFAPAEGAEVDPAVSPSRSPQGQTEIS